MMNNSLKLGLSILLISLVSACAYNPVKTTPDVALPESFQPEVAATGELTEEWWQSYQQEELAGLLQELRNNNRLLKISQYRIDQAQALARQQSALHLPQVSFVGNGQKNRNHKSDVTTNVSNLGFEAAYEVDLWGKIDAASFSADLGVVAAREENRSTLLRLQTQFVTQYFTHLALTERVRLAELNLTASEELLALIQIKLDLGGATETELNQQRNASLNQQALLIELKRDLKLSGRALAIMLGRDGVFELAIKTRMEGVEAPKVAITQPAQLLESRPDIVLAEINLQRQNAALYQSKKKRWPSLNISANSLLNDNSGGPQFWASSLIGGLVQPVFNGGQIRSEIDFTQAEVSVAMLNYQETVTSAIHEVMENLTVVDHQRELFQLSEKSLSNSAELYQVARLTYDAGTTDFLSLLTAQNSWFTAQDQAVLAKLNYLMSTVNLYRSLGTSPQV